MEVTSLKNRIRVHASHIHVLLLTMLSQAAKAFQPFPPPLTMEVLESRLHGSQTALCLLETSL